jgi:hypothetical protein
MNSSIFRAARERSAPPKEDVISKLYSSAESIRLATQESLRLLQSLPNDEEVRWEAADEIERLRDAGDALAQTIKSANLPLTGAMKHALKVWVEVRHES